MIATNDKTLRRTFTIPEAELKRISETQSRCHKDDLSLNDSEVVRAGLAALVRLKDKEFLAAVKSVKKLPRGRRRAGKENQPL